MIPLFTPVIFRETVPLSLAFNLVNLIYEGRRINSAVQQWNTFAPKVTFLTIFRVGALPPGTLCDEPDGDCRDDRLERVYQASHFLSYKITSI